MSKAHYITPVGETPDVMTVRLGSAIAVGGVAGTGGSMSPGYDDGKIVKLVGESQFDLCVAGDNIEAIITSVEQATSGGWTIGGIVTDEEFYAQADGLQATPGNGTTLGTGTILLGDYVCASNQTAKGTALSGYPRVCKATSQAVTPFMWRVLSLGTVGTGAPGTTIVLSRIGG